jgi:hypothetical protein
MSKSRFKKLSHAIYECKHHVAFCPKYRYRIFKDDICEYSRQQIYQLCSYKEQVEILELNVQLDHVHLVFSIPKFVICRVGILSHHLCEPIQALTNNNVLTRPLIAKLSFY